MSYILDALKKLEKEKEKKARSDGMVSISGALLRDEPRRPSGWNAWKIATVAVVVISLSAFGVTWFMVHGDKRRGIRRVPLVAQSPPVAKVTTPTPPTAAPPAAAVQQPAPAAPPAPPVASLVESPKPRVVVSSAPAADAEVPNVANKKQTLRQRKQKMREDMPAVEVKPAAPVLTPPPADIKVSGIAWQDERNARRAVVNGFLMREGSVVSGARITEILKDRVRFSTGDKAFEATLIMNIAPGTGK